MRPDKQLKILFCAREKNQINCRYCNLASEEMNVEMNVCPQSSAFFVITL